MARIGDVLRANREKRGWTQQRLGEHLDLNQAAVSSIERGVAQLERGDLLRAMEIFSWPADLLDAWAEAESARIDEWCADNERLLRKAGLKKRQPDVLHRLEDVVRRQKKIGEELDQLRIELAIRLDSHAESAANA